jgi:hypothetical protein
MKHNTENTETEMEFTEEQEAAIQTRILKDREREHQAIAGDRFYRLGIAAAYQSVQSGMDDEEVLRVGKKEWDRFKEANPLLGKKVDFKESKKPVQG